MTDTQHDDHIWLTVGGEPWAIRAIEHSEPVLFHLWRGYFPELEYRSVEIKNPDWDGYCKAAVKMLDRAASVLAPRTARRLDEK